MRIDFVTLFPEMVWPSLDQSMLGKAAARGLVEFGTVNPRDYCYDRHQKVDDAPYGGEAGMLLRAEPVALAVEALHPQPGAAVVLTAPTGKLFTQADATLLSRLDHVVLLCGHYEGFDHRVELALTTHVFSIGDFVLTNGELPALVIADAVVRLIPEVLGSAASLNADSFTDGLLSAPNFTKPDVWRGLQVPPVLKSGDHRLIEKWRRAQSLDSTWKIRPDLICRSILTQKDADSLAPSNGDS